MREGEAEKLLATASPRSAAACRSIRAAGSPRSRGHPGPGDRTGVRAVCSCAARPPPPGRGARVAVPPNQGFRQRLVVLVTR